MNLYEHSKGQWNFSGKFYQNRKLTEAKNIQHGLSSFAKIIN